MAVGDEDDDVGLENALVALLREAIALHKAGRWKDAAERLDEFLARNHHPDTDRDVRLRAMHLKVVSLHEHGDAQGTLAASDALLAAYGSRADQRAIGFLADTLWLKARALARVGDH